MSWRQRFGCQSSRKPGRPRSRLEASGKTAGRGIKGQKSRSGVAINAYEGGQMPLYMRLPKRGFNKPNRKAFAVINLGVLQKFVDAGKIDAKAPRSPRRRWSPPASSGASSTACGCSARAS